MKRSAADGQEVGDLMNLSDFGINIGELKQGKYNSICDVKGVKVGHVNIDDVGVHTGVSAVLVSEQNPYLSPLPAAVYVLNGFGKSAGLMQVEELGELESHIILTNTLSVGACMDGLVRWNIEDLKEQGADLRSFNPVVCECNDSKHNDISKLRVGAQHVKDAISAAKASCLDFAQGSVGAGRGMTCHGLKGGIGSASRLFSIGDEHYTIGALVLSNYGAMRDLTVGGKNIGRKIAKIIKEERNQKKNYGCDNGEKVEKVGSFVNSLHSELEADRGSIIILMATDLPLSSRQIKRVLKRGAVGLSRVGSHMGHGSGDVLLGFTTANKRDRAVFCKTGELSDIEMQQIFFVQDVKLDIAFRAFAECVEEAILQSLFHAEAIVMSDEEKNRYPDKEYARALSEFIVQEPSSNGSQTEEL